MSEGQYCKTQDVIDALIDKGDLTPDEEEYLDLLGTLLYTYEEQHVAAQMPFTIGICSRRFAQYTLIRLKSYGKDCFILLAKFMPSKRGFIASLRRCWLASCAISVQQHLDFIKHIAEATKKPLHVFEPLLESSNGFLQNTAETGRIAHEVRVAHGVPVPA